MLSKITFSAMYGYGGDRIFDGVMRVPGVDYDTFIQQLIIECDEKPLVFQSLDAVKIQLAQLSKVCYHSMLRTWNALIEEYDPLHNYDRHAEWLDESKGNASATTTPNTSEETSYMGDTATTFNPASKVTQSGTNKSEGSSSDESKHTERSYGNIGVTTSQQMLTAELDLRYMHQWYADWAQIWARQLCIGIY